MPNNLRFALNGCGGVSHLDDCETRIGYVRHTTIYEASAVRKLQLVRKPHIVVLSNGASLATD